MVPDTFTTLAHAALLGTARGTPPDPPPGPPLHDLVNALDRTDPAAAFLSRAALTFLHAQAGRLAARSLQPAPVPAPQEKLPCVNAAAASCLAQLLSGRYPELLPEWLRLCAASQHLAPPELLPALLNHHPVDENLHTLQLPVLGARGRWLASASPAWSWVFDTAAEDDSIWETGASPARVALLGRVRRRDSARARTLLAATWHTDTPEDRAAFIGTIGLNLQPEDEPFLEKALTDKRKEIRSLASATLSRLPQSGFARRMLDRLEPLLSFTPAASGSLLKLKKAQPASLEIKLPDTCGKEMQRDAIEPKPPKGTGEKTWWLIQLLTAAPLTAWETKWHLTPAELIAASLTGESGNDLVRAWIAAALAQKNAAWAEALLYKAPRSHLDELLTLLSPPAREQWYTSVFTSPERPAGTPLAPLLAPLLLEPADKFWSPEFSRTVLTVLRALCTGPVNYSDYALRSRIHLLALRLDPGVLHSAPTGWPTQPGESWTFWQPGIDPFLQLCQFRTDMRAAFLLPPEFPSESS